MPPNACTMPAESSHGIGFGSRRSKSGIAKDNIVDIDEVIELSSTPRKGTFLVDVRNKHEMDYGIIPSAVNIPLPELIEALQLDDEDFENEYGVKVGFVFVVLGRDAES
ncbi:hypothetical protein SARC_07469 [Sphaeroforma arctica JP610]|uniref:Rhodanese domain-containing protein n=1 Tax=Sphaeroforma arctica JP610 TaxID=667725 RepID=A0A0L0FUC7_9EUKA|nr:hypothetical protein SARC_07469 [Sphaeroforma arctica JP610]KNC80156.1 hypothetical protein SARC_07469 [Sphaeroforma arctica JP610]|eukprot:XP_014154058.1 hypothetical protein SARC_07469 [Sphaeroforma arctica JP610]